MRATARGRIAAVLGLPGATSYRRFERFVRGAAALEAQTRDLDDDRLRAEAVRLAAPGAASFGPATAPLLAVLREAAARSLGLRAFDEQLLACCALVSGGAVELDTGEGKTLAGALAAAAHALSGRSVHVLSVNDYLAERDAQWMGPFFALLGIEVAWVGQHTAHADRQHAYDTDVVYAPVSEVGFDVLRDRFVTARADRVAPVLDVAIVDEADAVMIDEGMTPLVLAGESEPVAKDFEAATRLVDRLREGRDFTVDADNTTAVLTDAGLDVLEARLDGVNLYGGAHIETLTRINLALHARALLQRDVDYLVHDDTIRLINTGRGRVAHLQRWPDGLHAAVEAKERVPISAAGVILDSITVRHLLDGYTTLSGMSGTVLAVATDLHESFGLPVGRVERRTPNRRVDLPDRVLLTERDALRAVGTEVAQLAATGRPVLVGTQSVAESEALGAALQALGIAPRVLNAKNDAEEAAIVARAGEYGAVTISTQMSGRGTDIRLGGPDERDRDRVVAAGGLAVIATGRYPSGRLDAQLRGRAGRQGDPGTSLAFGGLDSELVQAHVPTWVLQAITGRGEALDAARRRKIVRDAQVASDGMRRDRHRATWVYSLAIAAQRQAVLVHRDRILDDAVTAVDDLRAVLPDAVRALEAAAGIEAVAETVRAVTLFHLDEHWVQHLGALQELRDGIHLRALAGQDPRDEFHRIALQEFEPFFGTVQHAVRLAIERLTPAQVRAGTAALGLTRPGTTWTYMVTDDPFQSTGDRFARGLGRRWREKVLRIE